MYLLKECNQYEVLLLGRFRVDSRLHRALIVEPCHQHGLRIPRNSYVKEVLLPVVRNKRVTHQFWTYWNTTRVSLNCSEITQGILVIRAVFESFLFAAFMNQVSPILFIKISCSLCNGQIVSQCLEPSVCLSSWSQ